VEAQFMKVLKAATALLLIVGTASLSAQQPARPLTLSREEQGAIFDKFHRGVAALEAGTPGTGLGLAIVRAVVEAHRGKIEVRSQVHRGSSFRIVLPRCKAEAT
jgi:signal transduction histidine kinase